MRRYGLTALLLITLTMSLQAQSSEFGVRGLGLPGRGQTARSLGTAGGLSLFEGESSRNPAAVSLLSRTTAVFNATNSWRKSVNPAGGGSTYDSRFPQLSVGGPIAGSRLAIGVSNSLFSNRDFTVVSGGVEVHRNVPVQYTDTLSSRGGMSDLRFTVAWLANKKVSVGGGIDLITGQDRMSTRRVFEDSTYAPTRIGADLSYHTLGFTAGVLYQPSTRWQFAASGQMLGTLQVQSDSAPPTSTIKMPMTLSAAARGTLRDNLKVSAMISTQTWSRSNDGLIASGGLGARNSLEIAGGIELSRGGHPADNLPLRLGVRRATLPFALRPDAKAREMSFSIGSGIRFANQGGGIDFALERIHRSQSSGYTENAWQLTIGLLVRASAGGR